MLYVLCVTVCIELFLEERTGETKNNATEVLSWRGDRSRRQEYNLRREASRSESEHEMRAGVLKGGCLAGRTGGRIVEQNRGGG